MSPRYDTGYNSNLVLKVAPERDISVRTIYFNGVFPGLAGNKIFAQIPRYREEKIPSTSNFLKSRGEEIFYIDREFKSEEEAIELSILSSDGKILRTDRSVNYEEFMKR